MSTAIVLGDAEAIVANEDRTLVDTGSWKRLGKVSFIQNGVCEEKGHDKGKGCSEGF